MTEILQVGVDTKVDIEGRVTFFTSFKSLVEYLFKNGNNEHDTNHITVIVLRDISGDALTLESLSYNDKNILLKYFFNHLNLLVVTAEMLLNHFEEIKSKVHLTNQLLVNRINRVEIWTGTGERNINDYYNPSDDLSSVNDILSTMTFLISKNSSKSDLTIEKLTQLKNLIITEINFLSLLSNHSPNHLTKLTYLLGHWSFPAHELSNDDLVYIVYLIIHYSLSQIKSDTLYFPNNNELLGFIFMVRDTYKQGNQFHNFRHAVDVLHACFHFLVRLTCLKAFKQFQEDPNICALKILNFDDNQFGSDETELIQLVQPPKTIFDDDEPKYLNELQTLGLLIAALGHDVGHPGVTNAFMIKYSAPTSLIYNERSVLESFHSTVFINKILLINWPSLLTEFSELNNSLSIKELIISSILATDMGEHFDYIERLQHLKNEIFKHEATKVKLISSLLIKCADISNVARPLRVSSQWALVLGREFDEVNILERKIGGEEVELNLSKDLKYVKVPSELENILQMNKFLHKGQIFFISTFAENLFNNISEFLPELNYTCEIIQNNKKFWLNRDETFI